MKKTILLLHTLLLSTMHTQCIVYAGSARYIASVSGEDTLLVSVFDHEEMENENISLPINASFTIAITNANQDIDSVTGNIEDSFSLKEFLSYHGTAVYKAMHYLLFTGSTNTPVLLNKEAMFNGGDTNFSSSP